LTLRPALAILLLTACGSGERGGTNCGIVGLAGPSLLLEEFTKQGNTLGEVPEPMPERLVVRMAAGPAYPALVGRTDTSWVVGIDAALPSSPRPGFGVLVVDPALGVRGILLYEGRPVPGAPVLGTVNAGALDIPFHGLRASVAAFEGAGCPLFPDSLAR
jgi:hypothetical protein